MFEPRNGRSRTLPLALTAAIGLSVATAARSLKFISPILGDASGSLGGAVFSKTRGGIAIMRKKVIPTNPNSLLQTAIRAAVQSASALWGSVLTELQQANWYDIAEGAQTGKTLFSKVNQPRIYAANADRVQDVAGDPAAIVPAYIADPPSTGLTCAFQLDSIPVIDDSANTLVVNPANSDDWNGTADGTHDALVFVYISGPQRPTRTVRQRPYQLAACIAVDADGATGPLTIDLAALGIPTVTDRVYYVKTYGQSPDGRSSLPQEWRVTCVA